MATTTEAATPCASCVTRPAERYVQILRNVGLLVVRHESRPESWLCRECARGDALLAALVTFATAAFGLGSLSVMPWFVAHDLAVALATGATPRAPGLPAARSFVVLRAVLCAAIVLFFGALVAAFFWVLGPHRR